MACVIAFRLEVRQRTRALLSYRPRMGRGRNGRTAPRAAAAGGSSRMGEMGPVPGAPSLEELRDMGVPQSHRMAGDWACPSPTCPEKANRAFRTVCRLCGTNKGGKPPSLAPWVRKTGPTFQPASAKPSRWILGPPVGRTSQGVDDELEALRKRIDQLRQSVVPGGARRGRTPGVKTRSSSLARGRSEERSCRERVFRLV